LRGLARILFAGFAASRLCFAADAAEKFEKLWAFCELGDEAHAAKLAELNVQVARVRAFTPENLALANKYGIRLAISVWPGLQKSHRQVMTPEESYWQAEAEGRHEPSIAGLQGAARREAVAALLKKRGHAYGGEPAPENVGREVLPNGNDCFVGETARSNAVVALHRRLGECPGVGAVLFDFFGYANYRRCHHPDCERLYRRFLETKCAADTPENEKEFFLGEIVAMDNELHEAVKAYDPAIVTVAHLYPVYLPEPLYGDRLKFDRIGETCAWYQKWPDEKARRYAAACADNHPADYPRSRRVPFIGFSSTNGWVERKSAEDVERELKDILASGARELMVHEIESVFKDPAAHAVFRKYCGRN